MSLFALSCIFGLILLNNGWDIAPLMFLGIASLFVGAGGVALAMEYVPDDK